MVGHPLTPVSRCSSGRGRSHGKCRCMPGFRLSTGGRERRCEKPDHKSHGVGFSENSSRFAEYGVIGWQLVGLTPPVYYIECLSHTARIAAEVGGLLASVGPITAG
jgi:hypothetical protein